MKRVSVLLKSGMSINQALHLLKNAYPNDQRLQHLHQRMAKGHTMAYSMAIFFPWWCFYPFKNISIQIESLAFLSACESFLNYRTSWVNLAIKVLIYPLFTLTTALLLVILVSSNFTDDLPPLWKFSFIATCLGFFLATGTVALKLMAQVFTVSTIDILEVCHLSITQGWPLETLFNSLYFYGHAGKKWKLVAQDAVQKQSFIAAFSAHFPLPIPVKETLAIHERSGQLAKGFEIAVPLYRTTYTDEFKLKCHWLKGIIYGFIFLFILLAIGIIYHPIINASNQINAVDF
jgi:hypothetical protein